MGGGDFNFSRTKPLFQIAIWSGGDKKFQESSRKTKSDRNKCSFFIKAFNTHGHEPFLIRTLKKSNIIIHLKRIGMIKIQKLFILLLTLMPLINPSLYLQRKWWLGGPTAMIYSAKFFKMYLSLQACLHIISKLNNEFAKDF